MIEELESYLSRFIPGASVVTGDLAASQPVLFESEVEIGAGNKSLIFHFRNKRFEITRDENFSNHDRRLVDALLSHLIKFDQIAENDYSLHSVIEASFDRAVVNSFLDYNPVLNHRYVYTEGFSNRLLDGLEHWRNKTYEGKGVSFGIIVRPGEVVEREMLNLEHPVTDFFSVVKHDYMAPVSDGMNSFIEIANDGKILGIRQFDSFFNESDLPFRFSATTERQQERIVILTRLGDILLISDGKLRFVKKNKQWIHYNEKKLVERLTSGIGIESPQLKRAVFLTCLDVSLAKTGCVIGIVENEMTFDLDKLVGKKVRENVEYLRKRSILTDIVAGRLFQDIPRLIRKELASIDGCFIIDKKGAVICAGTIIQIEGGSLGGGRTAAAVALSKYGLGIKVSSDGYTQSYRKNDLKPILRID